jgi:hypothetical protein
VVWGSTFEEVMNSKHFSPACPKYDHDQIILDLIFPSICG